MRMGMFLRPSLKQEQRLEQRLGLEQRMQLTNYLFQQRLNLIETVHGERYSPNAHCPCCGRKLKPAEILKGFTQDPNDFTTKCPGCKKRFEPKLINFGRASRAEVGFYCQMQTLERLCGKAHLTVAQLKKDNPAVFHSALVHFGSIAAAFDSLGVKYAHKEVLDWKEKISSFLGRMSDSQIASCVGVSSCTIGRYRKSLNIPAYDLQTAMDNAGISEDE
ncbi:MAG: hypothetical protein V1928_02970 [Parcubacteria group bacterium]